MRDQSRDGRLRGEDDRRTTCTPDQSTDVRALQERALAHAVDAEPVACGIDEAALVAALTDATIYELAKALDPGAFVGDNRPDRFRCPLCRTFGGASVLDGFRWTCDACVLDASTTTSNQRTRHALRTAVAHRYAACVELLRVTARAGSERA